MEIGGDFCCFGAFKLYLGASLCIFLAYIVFILDVFIFDELYVIGGEIFCLFLFLVSHCATLIIDFIFMRLFMIYVL